MKETLSSKVPTRIGVTFVSESDPKRKLKSSPSTSTSTISTSTTTTTTASPPPPQTSYVIKCLLRTARFMWQVTTIPSKIGDTIGTLYRYAQDSVDSFLCVAGKARRKERDGDQNSTDTKLYLEESVLERKLPEADLKALVDLPAGLDYNEWLASHTLALFEHVNLVYGTISEFCTQSGCADMTGPGNRTYLWFDEKGKKTRVAAPQYIDYVMTFTQKTVSDESIFPTKYANEFPGSFESIARKILRLQFHVIAHLYAAHFREIALLGLHTHLNLTFAHLTALHRRFNLIDEKETDVLRDLEVALRLTDDTAGCQDANSTATSSSSLVHEHTTSEQHQSLQQQQQQQQQQHHNSGSNSNSTSSAEALHTVNSQSNNGSTSASVSVSASLIDGDAVAPPICTQPEAGAGCKPAGSSGLLGGILGDLTSGEFGDTTRYCTSAVPQAATVAAAAAGGGVSTTEVAAATLNNGAGALHLNFSNNNNNNHLNHHHHHHHHHGHGHHGHHHHAAAATHQHQQQQQHQHSGLIQCNAAGGGGGGGGNATGGVATGGATAAASSTTTA
ncbi:MOB kinase activator-like 2 isoform X3 [Drosophila elegans]|uniref:MOB kinase activator-like 2 isoform X3 n=1 Tax=Drosophila elegans TaxID=30023 RepID=UPI0007E7192D|nr:MOB kinase activator-like 2 isoform X3 [Drosophila elegans]XP_017133690.1 MOB kinase activator-like 2 isoform X3 [Drosophila elegans]